MPTLCVLLNECPLHFSVAQQLIFSKDPIVLQNSPLVFSPRTIFQDPRKVRIQGLKPQTNKEFLGLFFESKKMSGGGDIENIDFNVGKNEAVITFSHKRGQFKDSKENNEMLQ